MIPDKTFIMKRSAKYWREMGKGLLRTLGKIMYPILGGKMNPKYSRFKEERDALETPWVLGLDRQNKLPRNGPQMWFWKKLLATRGQS